MEPRLSLYLDKGGASKEEAEHVGHDVITDDTGDGYYKPGRRTMGEGLQKERGKRIHKAAGWPSDPT